MRFCSLKLNLNNYFVPQLRNSYKIDNLESYFKKASKKKLLDIFEIRLINKFAEKPKKPFKLPEIPESIFIKTCCFLDYKSIFALILCSNELNVRFFSKNEFWNRLYHSRFKRTGFKVDLILWKEAYIKKIKEKKT